jgi:hypothetical protein
MMSRSVRPIVAAVAAAACLWPVAAAAQEASPTDSPRPSVERIREAFAGAGFQVDQALTWDWTSPPVSTVRVDDPVRGRVLMVLVYPDTRAAQAARAHDPHLVVGFGQSVWRGNVALVETTQSRLDRMNRWQADCDNGMYIDPDLQGEVSRPEVTVDPDFLQALGTSIATF